MKNTKLQPLLIAFTGFEYGIQLRKDNHHNPPIFLPDWESEDLITSLTKQ